MALALPRIVVDLTGPAPQARAQRGAGLGPGQLTWLLAFDQAPLDLGPAGAVERCLSLGDRRWAVGRRSGGVVVWRLVDEAAVRHLSHPAWLWTRDGWFDPERPPERPGPTPPALPLRTVLQAATPVCGDRRGLFKAIAATIAAWRRRRLGQHPDPVAVVVPEEVLASASAPARAFALAVLCCLPPGQRDALRMAVGERAPDPRRLDLVLCPAAPDGFQVIDARQPPDEGEDLVAYFLRNRLHTGDTEAVEAVAFAEHTEAADPWGEAVKARLRDGIVGLTQFDEAILIQEPERAVRMVSARLRAGATLDEAVVEQLVRVTLRTGDPRPWAALGDRPAVSRARAVKALLAQARALQPRPSLLRVLGALYPPGAEIKTWLEALMGWFQGGSDLALELLEHTLLDWPASRIRATRSSLWSEVVRTLVRQERYDEAVGAVLSPVSRAMAREGAGRAVVGAWGAIPAEARSAEPLQELVALLAEAQDAGPSITLLFQHVRHDPDQVLAMARTWAERRPDELEPDPLGALLRDPGYLLAWVDDALHRGTPEAAGLLMQAITTGPDDPLWHQVADHLASRAAGDPREQLVSLLHLQPGLGVLEPHARSLLPATLQQATYPDPELAEVAQQLCHVAGTSGLWPWIAISAAPPDRFDEATVDATTVSCCQTPPASVEDQELALRSAHLLGGAEDWAAFDQARWIVRLTLAPDDGTGFHLALATAFVQGIARRRDAPARMAEITNLLGELEADHPTPVTFVRYLLPHAWLGGLPRMYIQAVDASRLHPALSQAWARLVGA